MEKSVEKCDLTDICGFYLKFKDGEDPVLMGFIRKYCHGPDADRCARKAYHREHGKAPAEDMLPSGRFFRF